MRPVTSEALGVIKGLYLHHHGALEYINQKENFGLNLDSKSIGKEVVGFLIDILIEDYAPKPLFEGWANLSQPYKQNGNLCDMLNSCVVLNPQSCCDFYKFHGQQMMVLEDEEKEVRKMVLIK